MTERFRVGDTVRWQDERWFEGRITGRTAEEDEGLGTEWWDLQVTNPGTMYADVDMADVPVHVSEELLTLVSRPETGAAEGGCQFAYPGFGEFGIQHGTVLRCGQATNGRLFNLPVGAEDAVQVAVCELHADMLGTCLLKRGGLRQGG